MEAPGKLLASRCIFANKRRAMVWFGKVQNGKIIPEAGAPLAEGEIVRIERVEQVPPRPPISQDPADDLTRFAVHTGIRDLASQHDHYCSGMPKRSETEE
jgi:hypothetical protein